MQFLSLLINMLWPFGIFNSDPCVWNGLQETIVSMAIAGTALGAALGGQMNDALRRKSLIWMSDLMFSLSDWSHGCGPWTIHLDLWPFFGGIRCGCSIHDCTTLYCRSLTSWQTGEHLWSLMSWWNPLDNFCHTSSLLHLQGHLQG